MNSIFTSVTPVLFISKIIGPNFYEVKKKFGVHRIKIIKFRFLYYILKFVYIQTIFVLYLKGFLKIILSQKFDIVVVPAFFLTLSYELLTILIYFYEMAFYKKIFNIYCILDDICKGLRMTINFYIINKYVVFYFVIRSINFIVPFIFTISSKASLYEYYYFRIYFPYCSILWLIKETEICLLLYNTQKISHNINNLIERSVTLNTRSVLKKIFKFHSNLFEACNEISFIFNYIVVFIFIATFGAVFLLHKLVTDTVGDWLLLNCFVQWTLSNYIGLIHLVFQCVSAKTEVGFSL